MLIFLPQLISDFCPRTSKNFEALCTGEQGLTKRGIPLCYKDSLFHRVVPNGWVQGGGRHLPKSVHLTNKPSQTHYRSQCMSLDCWRKPVYRQIPHRNPLTPGDSNLKPFCWEATVQIMALTCSVAIIVNVHVIKGLRCSDRMCLSDIYPERKGNGGESIYGPTFEGKSCMHFL